MKSNLYQELVTQIKKHHSKSCQAGTPRSEINNPSLVSGQAEVKLYAATRSSSMVSACKQAAQKYTIRAGQAGPKGGMVRTSFMGSWQCGQLSGADFSLGQVVPDPEDLRLSNDARKFERATV